MIPGIARLSRSIARNSALASVGVRQKAGPSISSTGVTRVRPPASLAWMVPHRSDGLDAGADGAGELTAMVVGGTFQATWSKHPPVVR